MEAATATGAAPEGEGAEGEQARGLGAEWRDLMKLAAPIAATQAGQSLMGLVDTAVVGRLGKQQLAAVGAANSLFFTVAVIGIGMMMGLDPLASQALGRGDKVRARTLLWQGAWLALVASLGLGGLSLLAPLILSGLGLPEDTSALAMEVLQVRVLAMPFLLLYITSRAYLQAVGQTKPLVISVVTANVVNFALNQLVVLGRWGIPSYGAVGSAWSTTFSTLVQLAILSTSIRLLEPVALPRGAWKPVLSDLWTAAKVGLPIGLQMGAEVGVFALVALMAGALGDASLGANQVALNLASFTFCLAVGVGNAGSVRVGWAVGKGDQLGVRRSGLLALATGAGVMSIAGLAFFTIPALLVGLMTDQADVAVVAVPLLSVAAVFQIADGLQGVGAGVLRGCGDTRFAFVANVVGHYGVGLPVALYLKANGWGLVGLWWGLCAGLMAVAAALVGRFWMLTQRPIKPLEAGASAAAAAH